MITEENTYKMFLEKVNKGELTTKLLNNLGLNSKDINLLIDDDVIKRISRGIYDISDIHDIKNIAEYEYKKGNIEFVDRAIDVIKMYENIDIDGTLNTLKEKLHNRDYSNISSLIEELYESSYYIKHKDELDSLVYILDRSNKINEGLFFKRSIVKDKKDMYNKMVLDTIINKENTLVDDYFMQEDIDLEYCVYKNKVEKIMCAVKYGDYTDEYKLYVYKACLELVKQRSGENISDIISYKNKNIFEAMNNCNYIDAYKYSNGNDILGLLLNKLSNIQIRNINRPYIEDEEFKKIKRAHRELNEKDLVQITDINPSNMDNILKYWISDSNVVAIINEDIPSNIFIKRITHEKNDNYNEEFNKGIKLYKMGKYKEAINTLEELIKYDFNPVLFDTLGKIYKKLNKDREAYIYFRMANTYKDSKDNGNKSMDIQNVNVHPNTLMNFCRLILFENMDKYEAKQLLNLSNHSYAKACIVLAENFYSVEYYELGDEYLKEARMNDTLGTLKTRIERCKERRNFYKNQGDKYIIKK